MRISKLFIPINIATQTRLKEINLTRKPLGSVIALVGKNGAGKSRVLKLVENYFDYISSKELVQDYITLFPKNFLTASGEQNFLEAKQNFSRSISKNLPELQRSQSDIRVKQLTNEIISKLREIGKSYIKVVDNDDLKQIKTNLANKLTFEQILTNKYQDNNISRINEFENLNSTDTIKYFNSLSTKLVTEEFNLYLKEKNKPDEIQKKLKDNISFKLFTKFQYYVQKFLGKDFSYRSEVNGSVLNSILYFNDFPFDVNLLSPGQKTLFAYAILFFFLDTNSKTNLKDSIIIIDEPEKHLHPEAQILLINSIKEIISKTGQLWIATHSINILAHLEFDEIVMMKDDEIIPPSRTTPGNSFNDLMGLDEHINELVSFINSISEWAYGNFMVQCFKNPDSIFNNDTNDIQFQTFKKYISSDKKTTLLDFGAGKGRTGYTVYEDENLRNKIQYYAYEPDKGNFDILSKIPNIIKFYKNLEEIPENFFDIVLLCNVLHEINPKDWVETFEQIKRRINPNGYLIILEDLFLPKGENAHQFGYLILGIDQIRKLFKTYYFYENIPDFSIKDVQYKERIMFSAMTRDQISISHESVKEAIKSLKEASFNNIKLLRKQDKNLDQGRKYANQTQLYINSQLALEFLNQS